MKSNEELETELQRRKEPIVLTPEETCNYVDICPYKKPNCFGDNPNRKWRFICDIEQLKALNGK